MSVNAHYRRLTRGYVQVARLAIYYCVQKFINQDCAHRGNFSFFVFRTCGNSLSRELRPEFLLGIHSHALELFAYMRKLPKKSIV